MGTIAALRALRGQTPTRLHPWDRVLIARRALDGHPHGTTPRTVSTGLGVRLLVGRPRGCGGECVSGDSVVVRHHHDPRERALLAWHGLAHVLLTREGWDHDEGDAWLVTLELAVPQSVLGLPDETLVERSWCPERVVRAWLPLARRLGLRRAA